MALWFLMAAWLRQSRGFMLGLLRGVKWMHVCPHASAIGVGHGLQVDAR